MDESLLAKKGIEPSGAHRGYVDGYALRIGERATLVRSPGSRAYGAVMDINPDEAADLYAEASVADYLPEPDSTITNWQLSAWTQLMSAIYLSNIMKMYSTITCPECGYSKRETMPADACHFFYHCEGCGALLKPREGDCCVYCSYGDTSCPPVQKERSRRDSP